jgi:hypothetical protein
MHAAREHPGEQLLVVHGLRQPDPLHAAFGPEAPKGKESNWIQTVPGKGWFTILRLYSPLDAFFDKTWKAGEIELID